MKTKERNMDLPEEIVINIIARLPTQSIGRFKSVCREWKSYTESELFRDLYLSNSNSTSWYSILHGDDDSIHSGLEELKLGLPRDSLHGNSSFTQNKKNSNKIRETRVVACTDGLVLLRLGLFDDPVIRYYIGNPVLPQWIQLPRPCLLPRGYLPNHRNYNDSGLVTRMHNRTLLGYKVVLIHREWIDSRTYRFLIFSSDTGEWSVKQVLSRPGPINVTTLRTSNPVSLNGKLHWLDHSGRVIVHDFFSRDDQVRAISLPAKMQGDKIICTTSQGSFVLIDAGLMEDVNMSYNVRVWRLECDSWSWEMAWEINMASVGLDHNSVPMAINFFDIDVIYLWDFNSKCFLACNLRTNTKSYGARKYGTPISSNLFKTRKTRKTRKTVYKEDTLCFQPWSCLSQFVPSLQVVPRF